MLVLEDPQLTTVPCVPREEPHVWGKAVWGWGKLWTRRQEATSREAVTFLSLAPTFQGWFLLRQGIVSLFMMTISIYFLTFTGKRILDLVLTEAGVTGHQMCLLVLPVFSLRGPNEGD